MTKKSPLSYFFFFSFLLIFFTDDIMGDNIEESLLRNCTAMVLSVEFHHSAKVLEHHNSTNLLSILGSMLNGADLTLSKRTMAKDRLHDCVYPLSEPSHSISLWHKLIWSAVFVAMLIVAIVGNSIVIWIVAGKRKQDFFFVSVDIESRKIINMHSPVRQQSVYLGSTRV